MSGPGSSHMMELNLKYDGDGSKSSDTALNTKIYYAPFAKSLNN